jgi:thiosulfate/3-mercaptopyruvate sulfurtransferase
VALLDGGWAKWASEGHPVRAGEESRAATSFMPSPKPRMVTRIEAVQARMGDGRTLLVDARGADRFEGRTEPIDKVAGQMRRDLLIDELTAQHGLLRVQPEPVVTPAAP